MFTEWSTFVLNWKTPYIPLPSFPLGTLSFLSALCLAFFLVVADFFLGESILAICSCSWLRLSSISSSVSWSELYSAVSSSLSLSTTPFSTTTVKSIQYLTMYAYRRKEQLSHSSEIKQTKACNISEWNIPERNCGNSELVYSPSDSSWGTVRSLNDWIQICISPQFYVENRKQLTKFISIPGFLAALGDLLFAAGVAADSQAFLMVAIVIPLLDDILCWGSSSSLSGRFLAALVPLFPIDFLATAIRISKTWLT